jgi:hypothetical protein
MDIHKYDRKEDTGKIELERIIKFVKENNYNFTKTYDSKTNRAYSIVEFEKEITYSEKSGNWINDRHIKIMIEFDNDFDYKNITENEDGDHIYNSEKRYNFIEKLIDKTYDLDEKA